MSLKINFSRESYGAWRYLQMTNNNLFKSMEKLSSGLRINRAADDPAGLVISEKMRAQIASLNQEIENTTMMIRKYETADSTLNELRSGLRDMRAMAISASNEAVNDKNAIAAYENAANMAVANYNQTIANATYNGRHLLDGGEGALANLDKLDNLDFSSPEKAAEAVVKIDGAMSQLDRAQVDIGATQKNELESRRSNLEVTAQNLRASESGIRDADFPGEIAGFMKNQIQLRAGMAMLAQANMVRLTVLKLFGS